MSVIEFLSQPFWYRLGLTLTHFLWQGLAVLILVSIIVRVFRPMPGNTRYCAFLLSFVFLAMCPVITFTVIDVPMEPAVRTAVIGAESRPDPDTFFYNTPPSNEMQVERDAVVGAASTQGNSQRSTPLRQRVYNSLQPVLPWAMAGWMIGVVLLSGRLLLGFVGICRWRRHLKPLPKNLTQRVTLLCERLGMRRFSRVFISPSAVQAMAAGYLRPLVLLPASMMTQMQPEMLEAVIAHELAHIRRFDLWINLAQRVIETLLFYHPAVWWLSSQIRSERELCCDELAVRATGERLIYASALENAGRVRFEAEEPALSLAFGHPKNPMLGRVRYVLGLPPVQPDSRFWVAGLITFVALVVIAMPITSAFTARAEEKAGAKSLHEAVANGDIELVKSLLSKGVDINAKDEKGQTALYAAVLRNRIDLILLLASNGANLDAKDKDGRTVLSHATMSGTLTSVVQQLLALGADPNIADASGDTPLHYAARNNAPGGIFIARELVAKGADINAKNADGRTPVHVKAAQRKGVYLMQLLELGADLSSKDKDGNNVLHLAILHARPSEKERVLEYDVDVNQANAKGQTPLHLACWVGHKKLVEGLILKGANLEARDNTGYTALHTSVLRGHADIAGLLVDKGASIEARTEQGHTPAYLAIRSLESEVADQLIKKGADTSHICVASYAGDLPKVKALIADGTSVNAKDEEGFGPLHAAAGGGHKEIVEYLLSRGADPEAQVRSGWTALGFAAADNHMETVELLRSQGIDAGTGVSKLLPIIAWQGYTDAAKYLIALGADVNINNGAPLYAAAEAGHKDMVELLAANNANVNLPEGWTPLCAAVSIDRPDIVACLIEAGADVDTGNWTALQQVPDSCKGTEMAELLIEAGADVNRRGYTPLHCALDNYRIVDGKMIWEEDLTRLLLAKGANPNIGNWTPLHEAAWYNPNAIKVLVEHGADINARNKYDGGWTPLHYAYYYCKRDSVQQLVALGADINARTYSGETILHLAAARGRPNTAVIRRGQENYLKNLQIVAIRGERAAVDFIEFLLTQGADLNARDNFGWTPLHRAASFGKLEVVSVLLAHGAKTDAKTNDGKTARDLARESGHKEIVELLKKHGAKE
jgi:cytohesin